MRAFDHLFRDTYAEPVARLTYALQRRLRAVWPDRAVLEASENDDFQILELSRSGLAEVVEVEAPDGVFQHRVGWQGIGEDLEREALNTIYEVRWQGTTLHVVIATWTDDGCEETRHFVVAQDRELAESFYVAVCTHNARLRQEVLVFEGGRWDKSEELYRAIQSTDPSQLILADDLWEKIASDVARFLASKELYAKYGVPYKRGVLLSGPPGNGKTLTVKALVRETGLPCLLVKSLVARHATSHDAIAGIFERARQSAPCVLVFEDLDAIVNDDNRSLFLNEMDGFADNAGVLTLATTNHPESLDPAILNRPSRFDRRYAFGLPAENERRRYLDRWNERLEPEARLSPSAVDAVVDRTRGFSFAFIKELCLVALCEWMEGMTSSGGLPMDDVAVRQAELLRHEVRVSSKRVGLLGTLKN